MAQLCLVLKNFQIKNLKKGQFSNDYEFFSDFKKENLVLNYSQTKYLNIFYPFIFKHSKKYFLKQKKKILPWLFEISPPVSSPVTEAAVAELEGSLSSEVTERLTDAAGLRSNKLTLRLKLAKSPIYRRTMTSRYHLLVHLGFETCYLGACSSQNPTTNSEFLFHEF